jgi:hypothetical protein
LKLRAARYALRAGGGLRVAQDNEGLGFDHPVRADVEKLRGEMVAIGADARNAMQWGEVVGAAGVSHRCQTHNAGEPESHFSLRGADAGGR